MATDVVGVVGGETVAFARDTVTAATDWSRATRIGGVQLGTNFALQPYLVTAPLPSFVGSATLPSKVDLYIDGVRRYSGEVPAGPFSLNAGANQINGAGRAQVVLTDMLGQVSTLAFSLYNTPRLLGKGISDWSVEAGAVRRNYGLASFDYAHDPVVSATWRRGLSDHVTAEAHGEAGPSVVDLGFGGAWLLGASGGVVSASLGSSDPFPYIVLARHHKIAATAADKPMVKRIYCSMVRKRTNFRNL